MSAGYTVFPNAPVIQAMGPDDWVLRLNYINRYTGRFVRRGFRFDGASIPRALWRVAGHPMQGDVLAPALEHDADYAAQIIPRKAADDRFLFNMEISGVGFWKRYLFYWAVRVFGRVAWTNNTPNAGKVRRFVKELDKWEGQNGRNCHGNVKNSKRK